MWKLIFLSTFVVFLSISSIEANTNGNDDFRLKLLLDKSNPENKKTLNKIANYRHRFEHSPFHKKLQFASFGKQNPIYCDLCDLLVPVVIF